MKTPILFLIFHRLDVTVRVFAEIRKQQPRQLFIAGDGGRTSEEQVKCEATRKAILDMINWKCEVKTLFRDKNIGCRAAVSSAITWFFKHVEQGIILEEDNLPHPSFFPFCEELLERYKDDARVMTISGSNFQDGQKRGDCDYYFSHVLECWGWASWRRAWKSFKPKMEGLEEFKASNCIANCFPDKRCQEKWLDCFSSVSKKRVSSWAYVWAYSILRKNGLNIMPNVNLTSNIGFDAQATHTKGTEALFLANQPVGQLVLLDHPSVVRADHEADLYTMKKCFGVLPQREATLKSVRQFLKFCFLMKPIKSIFRKCIRRI